MGRSSILDRKKETFFVTSKQTIKCIFWGSSSLDKNKYNIITFKYIITGLTENQNKFGEI